MEPNEENKVETAVVENDLLQHMEEETARMFNLQAVISEKFLILKTVYGIGAETLARKISTLTPKLIVSVFRNPNYDYGISIGELDALNSLIDKLLDVLEEQIQVTITY
jgi:hypothetical protein